jgi:hypothetical protein
MKKEKRKRPAAGVPRGSKRGRSERFTRAL